MERRENAILTGSLPVQILLFFFPVLFGTLFQQLYNTVDAVIVGNYVGKEALAAVGGSPSTMINLLLNFITGISSGASVVIAQAYGKSDWQEVKNGVRSGFFLAGFLGLIMMAVGILGAPWLLKTMNVPADVYPYSLTYMRTYFLGLVPSVIYNMGAGVLRAIGDSRRPLYFLIVSCFVNIVLDLLFVVFFGLGVFGVAVATVISQIASCVLVLVVLGRSHESYGFVLKEFGFVGRTLKRIVVLGLPMGLQSVLYSVSNLSIHASVNTFGTDTVAAYAAFGKIDGIFWDISGALGTASLTIVGQNFGARKLDRVKKAMWTGLLMDLLLSVALAFILCFGGTFFYHLFTKDEAVILIGMDLLKLLAPYWFTFSVIEIFSCSIRACGDSFNPMLMTALGICGTRMIWIFSHSHKTVFEALYCYPISWILTSILFLLYYFSSNWLEKCLLKAKGA